MTFSPASALLAMPIASVDAPPLGGGFSLADWLVVAAVMALVTWAGHRLTGRQESLRDFYLGGRRLPWYAVSASIIATEISAVTFFAVPSLVWREGGSIHYLQIGLISALVARLVVAFVLTPAYYEREIYSPYDFMGDRLGRGVRRMTTGLFMIGGVLAQAARVYITAVIIEVLAREQLAAVESATGLPPLAGAILAISIVATAWTWIGGVATVVWTDALLFLMFIGGFVALLAVMHGEIPGGVGAAVDVARESGKLSLTPDGWGSGGLVAALTTPYGAASVLVGASWGLVGPYGTDQLMAQRMLACANKRQAQFAVLGSYFSVVIVGLAFLVGVGLIGYYEHHEMSEGARALVAEKPDRILPVFVREALPVGLRGLVLAAAFAAAISSLDSILAALGQATQSLRPRWDEVRAGGGRGDGGAVRSTRVIVLVWAVILAGAAMGMQAVEARYADLLSLALGMSAMVGGPLLAAFALGWIGGGRGASGFLWSAPLGVLAVAFAVFPGPSTYVLSWWIISGLFALWLFVGLPRRRQPDGAVQTLLYGFVLFLLTRVAEVGDFDGEVIQWPWYVAVGSAVTFVFALALDRHGPRG
ncbi:MAG: hypothetical protein VX015_14680 [Planctomycetota bacterium]|nr:hypothetical protein [Planctomycetota bacterium]